MSGLNSIAPSFDPILTRHAFSTTDPMHLTSPRSAIRSSSLEERTWAARTFLSPPRHCDAKWFSFPHLMQVFPTAGQEFLCGNLPPHLKHVRLAAGGLGVVSGVGSGLFLLAMLLAGPDVALSGALNDFELYLPAFDTLYKSDELSCCGALDFSISSALARAVSSARAARMSPAKSIFSAKALRRIFPDLQPKTIWSRI